MRKRRTSFRFRQLRTMVLLCLLIGACVSTGLYFRNRAEEEARGPAAAYSQSDLDDALARYRSRENDEKAALVTEGDAGGALKASLLFYGACDTETAQTLVTALKGSSVDASFFLSANDLRNNAEMVALVYAAGYPVGVVAEQASSVTGTTSAETLVTSLTRSGLTMQADFGMYPSSVLVFSEPTDDVLYAATAAYYSTVYWSESIVSMDAISSESAAKDMVDATKRGSMLCVSLASYSHATASRLSYLAEALAATNLDAKAKTMLTDATKTEVSDPVTLIHTTERAVAFTFSGMGSDAELNGVLSALKECNATAVFFVTERELEQNGAQIRKILEAGHELGASVKYGGSLTDQDVLESILREQETLQATYGYTGQMLVYPASGNGTGSLASAAAAGGFTVVSPGVNVTSQEDARATSADEVLARVLPETYGVFRRGEIVHFQMNLYQSSDALLGQMVQKAASERNIYAIRSAAEILNNEEYTYTYPVAQDMILPEVKDKIYAGQLTGNNFAQITQRYIGIDWVNNKNFLPGFTADEIKLLDKSGLVPNSENMVFLSFDDWGTDETITALLDVLKRHNAKATFFVRSNFVATNPNLLRAIAMDGHTIASHTSSHYPLSNLSENGKTYTELTEEQVTELRADLIQSYQELQSVVGDVSVNGKAALSRLFRPPTLAVSRSGLETVLDCGYTYSVSGSYTTQDYSAKSREALQKTMISKTCSGAVLIMHMSDNSVYTADALQGYFDYWEKNPPKTGAYKFGSLTDVLTD